MTRQEFSLEVRATQGGLRRFLVSLCAGDTALADDIAQESYMKAYLACDTFRGQSSFATWIALHATNSCRTGDGPGTSASFRQPYSMQPPRKPTTLSAIRLYITLWPDFRSVKEWLSVFIIFKDIPPKKYQRFSTSTHPTSDRYLPADVCI